MIPITEREENQMYGEPVTPDKFQEELDRASEGYDEDDLQMVCVHHSKRIIEALEKGWPSEVGRIFHLSRIATINRRAEIICFGKITTPEYV